jgi:hypothetical protein
VIRIVLIVVLVLALLGGGFYLGTLRGKSELTSLEASQAQNTAKAVLAERASAQTELDRINQVVAKYEAQPIDPIALDIGTRVFKYANTASCPVPKATADPGRAGDIPALAPGALGIEQALDAYIEACSRDAEQLGALIQAWPR